MDELLAAAESEVIFRGARDEEPIDGRAALDPSLAGEYLVMAFVADGFSAVPFFTGSERTDPELILPFSTERPEDVLEGWRADVPRVFPAGLIWGTGKDFTPEVPASEERLTVGLISGCLA